MTRGNLKYFCLGIIASAAVIGASVFWSTVSFGTASSPYYGSAYEYVEATLTLVDGAVPQRATKELFLDDGAGSRGVWAWRMDDNPAIENELDFKIVPPRWRGFGLPATPIAIVSPGNTTSCNYRLCVEFSLIEVGKPIPPTTATLCQTFPSGGTTYPREVTLLDVPGISTTLDPVLHGRIYRNNTSSEDTCNTIPLWVHTIGVAFVKDRPGSRTPLNK